jgi:histidyl-tRNA synthetase
MAARWHTTVMEMVDDAICGSRETTLTSPKSYRTYLPYRLNAKGPATGMAVAVVARHGGVTVETPLLRDSDLTGVGESTAELTTTW